MLFRIILMATPSEVAYLQRSGSEFQKGIKECDINPVITVHKRNPFACGIVQAEIPRRTYSTILLMENPDAAIPRSIFITNLTGLVLAAVIDEKALEIGESLGQDAVYTAAQGRFRIIYRYYY